MLPSCLSRLRSSGLKDRVGLIFSVYLVPLIAFTLIYLPFHLFCFRNNFSKYIRLPYYNSIYKVFKTEPRDPKDQ